MSGSIILAQVKLVRKKIVENIPCFSLKLYVNENFLISSNRWKFFVCHGLPVQNLQLGN